jgi:lipopolysaccharide/colanic/teichoic acid biosynthesis glycosyltransferase
MYATRPEAPPRRPAPSYHSFGLAAAAGKRLFDAAIAGLALVLAAPFFLVIAVLIKLDSPGPVFFRQLRVGRHRRRFLMWKFRKMYDRLPTQGPSLTRRYDMRLTRVGRILERTKLDELPQLLNVLVGDMSVVGPRPEVPQFVEDGSEQWDEVLSVKPGLVGPCQLRFRNESELYPAGCPDLEGYYAEHILPRKLAVDADYASRYSLWADVTLLARCALVVVCGVVTRQTLANRWRQLLNTTILSLLGLAGTLAAARVASKPLGSDTVWRTVVLALLTKPLCLLLFKIPNSLATSVSISDLRRCCWCAAASGVMLGAGVFLTGHPLFGVLTLAADATTFLAILIIYKVACYDIAVRCRPQPTGGLRRLLLASLVFGPASMAAALVWRHPAADWVGRQGAALALLIALAAVVRPGVVLFTPFARRGSLGRWLCTEWCKRAVGTLFGSALLAAVALAVFQAEVNETDLALDAAFYLASVTALVAWRSRCRVAVPSAPQPGAPGSREGDEERLLLIGGAMELGAYISILSPVLNHRLTVVGALVPRRGCRTHTVGGVPILGEPSDAAQVVQALAVTRVVLVGLTGGAGLTQVALRDLGGLGDERVHRVEFPELFRKQWFPDFSEESPQLCTATPE